MSIRFDAGQQQPQGSAPRYSLWVNLPATMVAMAAPWKVRASKGELRDLLGEDFTL